MIEHNYFPIITSSTKQTFFDYINAIDIPQIDYFAIGVQNAIKKQSISLMSLPEWQMHFIENQYADYDPVRKVTLFTKRTIIPFNEIDFVDNFGKEIMRQRARMGISNGIIFMERFEKFNYMITLGTGFVNFDPFQFIKRYHDKIKLVKKDLINLIERETKIFLLEMLLNHPSNDAK